MDKLEFPVPEELETQRLVLRPFQLSDAAALHEALHESSVDLRRHLGHLAWVAEEPTLESAEQRCRKAQDDWVMRADFPLLAFDKKSQRLVASVGLHRVDWSVPKAEVGYWVRTSETRQGYASECVHALTDWVLQKWHAARVELVTDEHNLGSRKVALRCGFSLEEFRPSPVPDPAGEPRRLCVYRATRRMSPFESAAGTPLKILGI